MSTTLDTKDPAEKVALVFDFSAGVADGTESITTVTRTVTVAAGTDTSPSSILNGLASIVGETVVQPVQAGVSGNDYQIKVVASTTNPNKVLALSAILPVRE
jgi:hypothetical protein